MVDMSAQASIAVTRVTDALRSGTPSDVASLLADMSPGDIAHLISSSPPTTRDELWVLLDHEQEVLLLEGGKGGRGNATFKSSINQTPRQFTEGKIGMEGEYKFTLKTIADIGLVGFPNAGKSTLLNVMSNATPKIDSYPFTTLVPTVGVIDYPDDFTTLTMADVPGLIEGAAENRGLGHRFLRHVERCKLLLFLLDLAATDGRNPCDDFEHLRKELVEYGPALGEKPFLVVGNKIDEENADQFVEEFKKRFPQIQLLSISALLDDGLPELKKRLLEKLS